MGRYATVQQHQPLRIPTGWNDNEKQLLIQLEGLFDDIYRRFGRLRLADLGPPLAGTITSTERGVTLAAKEIALLSEEMVLVTDSLYVMAETIQAKADLIELDAYVKITDLEADVLEVMESANIYDLTVTNLSSYYTSVVTLSATSAEVESLTSSLVFADDVTTEALSVGGTDAAWKQQTVLTGIGTISQQKRYLTLMTGDGGTVSLDIVTDVSITPSTSTLKFLGGA